MSGLGGSSGEGRGQVGGGLIGRREDWIEEGDK